MKVWGVRLIKQLSSELPKTKKSSMKISRKHSTISLNMLSIYLWNVAGALHNPKGILWYAKIPNGHVKVVFSWSSSAISIWF
jgi:hypothetical protein